MMTKLARVLLPGLFALAAVHAAEPKLPAWHTLTSGKLAKVEVERPTIILRGSQVELGASPAFDEIARLEYQRSTGNGRLLALLKHEDDRVRTRAVEACGRLPSPAFGSEVAFRVAGNQADSGIVVCISSN